MNAGDPTGPETPEEPTAARDGQVNGNGGSIADQATGEEPVEPTEEPLSGDAQLSLSGLGLPRRTAVVGHVSLQSARREIDGRLDPERDHFFLVKGRVMGANVDYTRGDETPEISGANAAQKVKPLLVRRVAPILEQHALTIAGLPEEAQAALAEQLETWLEEHVSEEDRHLALV